MKHLQHPYETSETRRTHACNMHKPVAHHECLLIAVTACLLPQAIPLLLSVEGAAGASRRRELRV
jgi:hypothetical protein